MYRIGDLIVYGGSNCVCRITNITALDFPNANKNRMYYVMKPVYQDCVIYNPVDNTNVLMRPIITRDEAEKLIDTIPEIKAEAFYSSEMKQVAEHYESLIKTCDCGKLIELTMSIYAKKQFLIKNNRRFGSQEEMFMKRAEGMLFGELAVALDIPRENVRKYIDARVGEKIQDPPVGLN